MKKIFIIFAVVFVVSSIFFIVYKLNFGSEKEVIKKESTKEDISIKKESLYAISDEKSMGIFIDKEQEKILYYSAVNGNVIEADLDGRNKRIISNMQINNITNVQWSVSGKEALLKIGNEYFYHNIQSKIKRSIGQGLDIVSWNYDGSKIFFKRFNPESNKRTLHRADPSGENSSMIAETELRYISISPVPKTEIMSIWNSPRSAEETSLELIYPISNEKRKIFSSRFGADYKWSPDGKNAIVTFARDNTGKSLSAGIIDINGSFIDLGVPTLASKTAWGSDGKTFYYAAPVFSEGSLIPDDYESGKIGTRDTFWKIEIESGKKERLLELDAIKTEIDASEISVAPNGRSLIFLNKKDGLVYRLDF